MGAEERKLSLVNAICTKERYESTVGRAVPADDVNELV